MSVDSKKSQNSKKHIYIYISRPLYLCFFHFFLFSHSQIRTMLETGNDKTCLKTNLHVFCNLSETKNKQKENIEPREIRKDVRKRKIQHILLNVRL